MDYAIKHDIFISYRHKDHHIAALTESYLSGMKYDVFWDADLSNEELPNEEFPQVLEDSVKCCKDFILIITENTFAPDRIFNKKDWIYREIRTALENNIHILAFIVDDTKYPTEEDLPAALRRLVTDKQIYRYPIDPSKRDKSDIYKDLNKKLKSKPWMTTYQDIVAGSKNYDSSLSAEDNRLKLQAENTYDMDMQILSKIRQENPNRKFKVLDIGCASGFMARSRFNDDCYEKIVGIDRNHGCIDSAVDFVKNNAEYRSKFKYNVLDLESDSAIGDMENLMYSYDIEKFDIIFAAQVLHHLKDPVKCLQKLRRFLAPNGYVIIRSSDDGAKIAGSESDNKLIQDIIHLTYAIPGVADRQSGRKIYNWLQKSGFDNISINSFMRSTTNMDWDDRMTLFHESFGWRGKLSDRVVDHNSKNYVDTHNKLNELEQRFPDPAFWYCEFDFIGVGKSRGGKR